MARARKLSAKASNRQLRAGYVKTKKINQANSGAMQLGGRRF